MIEYAYDFVHMRTFVYEDCVLIAYVYDVDLLTSYPLIPYRYVHGPVYRVVYGPADRPDLRAQ